MFEFEFEVETLDASPEVLAILTGPIDFDIEPERRPLRVLKVRRVQGLDSEVW